MAITPSRQIWMAVTPLYNKYDGIVMIVLVLVMVMVMVMVVVGGGG